jgi:transcriptional regulator with XRE-family HTH domain
VSEEVLRRLGQEIHQRRKARGMTRVDLANESGIHRNYLMSVERGDRNVSVRNLMRIALALGTTLPELLVPVFAAQTPPVEPPGDLPGDGTGFSSGQ